MQIEGKSYISSKRASELSGYAQDYIGQLSRKSFIDARRIGGLWYVSMESLEAYKKKAEQFKPEPPVRAESLEPGTLIFFDGKEYLSAARAAEITGYAQDYVGQLARGSAILSHQVGNRWYVERQSILSYKREKDRLLAAVQSEAVGLARPIPASGTAPKYQGNISYSGSQPLLNYSTDRGDLVPLMSASKKDAESSGGEEYPSEAPETLTTIPIRKVRYAAARPKASPRNPSQSAGNLPDQRRSFYPLVIGAAATIIIVLSVGYASILRQNSVYATNIPNVPALSALPAAAASVAAQIGDLLEPFLTKDLSYQRIDSQ